MASSTTDQTPTSSVDQELNKIETLVEKIEIKENEANNLDESDDKKATNKINLNTPNRVFISKLLNRNMKIQITDGRVLIGNFLCTDKDSNIILGCCQEYVDSSK
jgi:small nuclear ribonucleoprotein (snRNP)-like protein